MTTSLSRRSLIASAAALPLAAGLGSMARATAPMLGAGLAPYRRVTLGEFEVTTILAGSRTVPDPQTIFGLNVEPAEFAEVSEAANIPTDAARFYFTPTVVNTGAQLVLFDTGLNAEGTLAALSAAGYEADQVDLVVITHMHGDHIGGLMREDGTPTFPNASYVTGAQEYDAWAAMGNEGFDAKMRPLAEQTKMLAPGEDAAPGITAEAAFGHTPGHMSYTLDSGGKSLVIGADFANHYVWSLAHPDWEVKFDMDKAEAAKSRRALLDRLAADRTPFIGYHMPFPALGYVETRGDGYAYAPESYQLSL
ncbi:MULTISPECIES: MBL fold metallo-hydrolase [Roseovarius]|uniref:Metallo-beta-lactamase domain-containing protein n=3 Tax=Roseovarius nubinhibens TaxID=314263 RepID=A3SRQ8_ROSNI|nr:MBL fold metallo-hydrolase [Roseovarius nubinhibens]EAP75281.1 hypothetical protein ISM_11855 [Roseovarius nubinhibens ISM]MBU2998834.1 MBL fold metallo-hydrolase [Roseovarius nubinhibens]